jgi:hypothetical protein
MNPKIHNLKINVSWEASVNFHHMSRKCHASHGICTLSPLDAALTIDSQNTQHDTSKVLRLPRKMTMEVSKVLHLPRKIESHPLKTMQKSCACLSHRTTFDT